MENKTILKKLLKYIWIVYGLFSIFIVLYLIDGLVCKDIMEVSNRYDFADNWDVTINGAYHENVSLDDFTFDTVNKSDVITIERIVPDDFEYVQACLSLKVRHAAVTMYVDGELKFEYGHERYEEDKTTGAGNLLINFPDEYKGKELKIEYIVTEDNAFSRFDKMWLTEWENSTRYIVTNNRIPLLMGCFLLVLGVMVTFIQIFGITFSTKYSNIMLLAIFSICMGIWTLCYYDLMVVFAIPIHKISLMEHMALFIAPVPILGYMYTYIKAVNKKIINIIYQVLFVAQAVLTVMTIAFHIANFAHGAQMLKYFHVMYVIHLLFVIYVIYLNNKISTKASKVSILGLGLVAFCIFYELATYTVSRYTEVKMLQIKGVSSVGLTIFIGILVIDLYQKVTRNMMEEKEKELLVRRAYTDDLTKLHNRAFCTEHMRKLSIIDKSDYAIINFDLNGLKKMNDTYGHMKGDELICYAAIVLEQTFSAEGVVGRMGGDEFIAILPSADTGYIDELLVKFQENIEKINTQKHDLNLSISFGYATSKEVDGDSSEKVYHIADERMYAYKQKVKRQ